MRNLDMQIYKASIVFISVLHHVFYAFDTIISLLSKFLFTPQKFTFLWYFPIRKILSHILLILPLKVSYWVTREAIKMTLHCNIPILVIRKPRSSRKELLQISEPESDRAKSGTQSYRSPMLCALKCSVHRPPKNPKNPPALSEADRC